MATAARLQIRSVPACRSLSHATVLDRGQYKTAASVLDVWRVCSLPDDELTNSKKDARAAASRRRFEAFNQTEAAVAASILTNHLGTFPEEWPIAGYLPIRTEIDPRPAMESLHRDGRSVCVPVVEASGQPLKFREWTPCSDLVKAAYGVAIPEKGLWIDPCVIVVPLLAYDRSGRRLGYGGGYYDRTIAALRATRSAVAVGFAFSGQELERVPAGGFDQVLDAVATECGIVQFR